MVVYGSFPHHITQGVASCCPHSAKPVVLCLFNKLWSYIHKIHAKYKQLLAPIPVDVHLLINLDIVYPYLEIHTSFFIQDTITHVNLDAYVCYIKYIYIMIYKYISIYVGACWTYLLGDAGRARQEESRRATALAVAGGQGWDSEIWWEHRQYVPDTVDDCYLHMYIYIYLYMYTYIR